MPLAEYARIVRRRGWVVIATALVGAVAALLFSMVQTPVYQSTIRLNVIGARPDLGLSQTLKGLLRNYASQIRSYDTATNALRDMPQPLDLTPERLLGKINVQAVESDQQLVIEAEDADPAIANMIAQQMSDSFIWTIKAFNDQLDQSDRVNVFTSGPATPGVKIRPQRKVNTLAGGILGAVLGLAIVALLEWLDSRFVRSISDLQRDAAAPVLGTVRTGLARGPSAGERWLGPTGVAWGVPLVGGIALGVLLTTIVYLLL